MAHQIDYRLVGDDMQAVIIALDPGEGIKTGAKAQSEKRKLTPDPSRTSERGGKIHRFLNNQWLMGCR